MLRVVVKKYSFLAACILSVATQLLAQTRNAPAVSAYRDYALSHDGDAARGKELFANEQKAACSKCHSVDGSSRLAGPDLFAIGDKFPKVDLIRNVLEPSTSIAVGYGTTIVERKLGEEVQGVIKQASDAVVELMGADGKLVRIPSSEIRQQRTSALSLMPEGLQSAMTMAEFTDLVAYLGTLRQPTNGLASASGMPEPIPRAAKQANFVPFFKENIRFTRPVWFGGIPGTTNAYMVLEHGGKSWVVEKGADGDTQTLFLDLTGQVRVGGATGLLGLAFHPKFEENRRYFLKYHIVEQGKISTLIVERRFASNLRSDSGEERQLLKVGAVTQDHNGGCIEFGPDGFLYIGMGDTGPQRDPQGHGQDLKLLIGKILRIDVGHAEGGRLYAIPRSNPFVNQPEVRPEIWAYGFREPWRFAFDKATGDLWVGDVGQDQFEEVGIVKAGENHGWNVYEGFNPFSNRYRTEGAKYVSPVLSYSHRQGVSVTGGYVYHGRRAPQIEGWYVFGDFESRRLWALTHRDRKLTQAVEIGRCPTRLASFSQATDGELYAVGYDLGAVYRLDLSGVDTTPLQIKTLAETAERAPVRWHYVSEAPSGAWAGLDFDDSKWPEGPGGFGSRGTPGAVVRTEWRSENIWLRREFTLGSNMPAGGAQSLALRMHHDEEAEVYLNGVEISREPRWTTGYTELPLNERAVAALRPGRNVLAIHCRQHTGGQYIDAGLVEYVKKKQTN